MGNSEPNTISIRREIPIRDYNDNTPQFHGRPYRATISESAKVGTEVTINPPIIVTDLDEGLNAECTVYCSSPGHVCDNFKIDTIQINPGNYTARISLRKTLDFETQPSYVLSLTARDNAISNKLSMQASISIFVIDVQDQVPVFVNAPYSATIEENTPADVSVLTIAAQDGDSQNPRPIILTLTNDDGNHFELTQMSNGMAILSTTSNQLDREDPMILQSGGVYTFNVTAIELIDDGVYGDSTSTQVTIILTDVEDNIPAFNKKEYQANIPENLEKGTPLPGLAILINDPDLGENSKYNLSLRNIKNSANVFTISPTHGEGRTPVVIKVLNGEKLDFDVADESDKEFVFELWATVNGLDVASAKVTVNLEDLNDNAPEFDQQSLTFEVMEDAVIGSKVVDVQATDKDSGHFKEISYVLKGFGSENFYTDTRSGGVYVKKKLDYEHQKSFSMTLAAIDGGQKETNLNLFINIGDVNDNYPMFDSLEYTRTIREGATTFEPQFFVHATDIDGPSQGGGRLYYTIDSENSISGHEFSIDSETGEIKIANRVSSMDTERGQYELMVSAKDFGEPSLSNNTRIIVRVGISGNQRPIFKNSNIYKPHDFPGPVSYKVSIPESSKPGHNVTKISATDPDGIDALLEYKILGANDNFEIHPHSGLIQVSPNARLDRDLMTDHYSVVVVAVDAGFPFPETATATILVSISDVNDEPPKFQGSYSAYISERAPIGSKVVDIKAIDPDLNANLSYSIIEPISASSKSGLKLSEDSEFDFRHAMIIDNVTGTILLNKTLNSNVVSVIVVTVKVVDLNAQENVAKQTSTTEVTIYVQSFKEIDPVFKSPTWSSANPVIQKRIKEETPIGQTVMTLEAEDPETHERITYFKILENDSRKILQLHEGTGELIISKRLDYEDLDVPYFNITISAINLENNRHSTAVVNFTVENVNDNDPIFSSKIYETAIMESAKYPVRVATVLAQDLDNILTSEDLELGYRNITYTLLGQSSSFFMINSTSGEIFIAPNRTLDRETNPTLKFQVQAEDAPTQPNESRKTIIEVLVKILDINDNAPQFRLRSFSTVIPENIPINTLVINVTATDPDEGLGGQINYDLFDEGEAIGLLRVDESNGMIYTKAELTGRGRSEPYEIVVRAQDKGSELPGQASLFSDVQLRLYIGDVSSNDGVPFFITPKLGQITNITENSPSNTPVFQIVASDPDSPSTPSGMLQYKIQNNTEDAYMFNIDPRTGMIVSKTSFDREVKSSYNIIIEVSDHGQPPLTVSRVLQIMIQDVDDNKPRFKRDIHDAPVQYSIQEEMPIGTHISSFTAIDEDIGPNAAIDYAIVSGNQEGHFRIERLSDNTGLLIANVGLDREKRETYLLTLKCFKLNDTAPRSKSYNPKDLTELQVLVSVIDVDDHLPQFKPNISDIGIRHNVAADSLITTVFADDEDPTAMVVSYSILNISYTPQFYKRNLRPESLDNLFSLNNETGELRTANVVHDFVDGYFSILICASNSENPLRHQNATLNIFIIRDKSLLRFVFTKSPIEVRSSISEFNEHLQKKIANSALDLHLFSPEPQVRSDFSLDFTSTSVCFQLSRHGSAIPPQQMEKLLNQPDLLSQLTEVYVNYSVAAIEPCIAKRIATASSWTNSAGVWLVVLAAFIGITALIATCVSCCLFKK